MKEKSAKCRRRKTRNEAWREEKGVPWRSADRLGHQWRYISSWGSRHGEVIEGKNMYLSFFLPGGKSYYTFYCQGCCG
ncbi:hypothetical protein ISN45_Aa07g025700 [Arabidopsis thaliana x Arabidopsis arenosa]|uniref:Uncharacterized protein n=1 Tax=Arabidopsis thaliana x Arabidopsis arenosa TaxID=1240361 RepID=A0A8T1Y6G6_9BRAS|nr:hypothetical protein ISN45_Aa07g025700 [Arabidopsis thaliana x Arabidopsis arenosa]